MNKFAIGCGAVIVILLFIIIVAALALGGSYNRLVRLQQSVDQSWAQVQNVYQRRADLIPNLVNTVSGAANFEKSTLVEVTNARASVGRVQLDPNKAPTDSAPTVSGRPRAVEQRALPSAGGGRTLSRTAGQPEFSCLTSTTRRNREPHFGRTRKLQHSGAELQHRCAQFPDKSDRRDVWFCAAAFLRSKTRRGTTAGGEL